MMTFCSTSLSVFIPISWSRDMRDFALPNMLSGFTARAFAAASAALVRCESVPAHVPRGRRHVRHEPVGVGIVAAYEVCPLSIKAEMKATLRPRRVKLRNYERRLLLRL
jgi:hypothetical protein